MGRRGASPNVQRFWHERQPAHDVHCDDCGALMDFEVRDPAGFGRSFQRCSDPTCARHVPHQMERQLE